MHRTAGDVDRRSTGEDLVEQDPEREEIGAVIDRLPPRLLGRHGAVGADDHVRPREIRLEYRAEVVGQLSHAFDAQLLDEADERVVFRHQLVHDAMYAALKNGELPILLGGDRDELIIDLQRRFGPIDLICSDSALGLLLQQVIIMIEQPALATAIPLDMRGTPFQKQVWSALLQVPAGRTVGVVVDGVLLVEGGHGARLRWYEG